MFSGIIEELGKVKNIPKNKKRKLPLVKGGEGGLGNL